MLSAGDHETYASSRLSFSPKVAALDPSVVEEDAATVAAVVDEVVRTEEVVSVEGVVRRGEVVTWPPLEQPAVTATARTASAQTHMRRNVDTLPPDRPARTPPPL